MARDIENIGTDERFTACDYKETTPVDLGNLIDESVAFFGGEFVGSAGRLRRRVQIAMVTFEITAFREVQCDEVRLEVIDGSAVRGPFALRGGREELRDLLLKRPNHSTEQGAVEDRKRFTHARMLQL
jgi:hypothetical protein